MQSNGNIHRYIRPFWWRQNEWINEHLKAAINIKTALAGKDTQVQSGWLSSLRPCYSGWARFLSFYIQLELLKQETTRCFSAGYLYTPCMTHNTWPASLCLMFGLWYQQSACKLTHHMEKLLICNQSCSSLKLTEAIRMLTFRNHRLCSLITVQNSQCKTRAWLVVRVLKKSLPQTANKVRQSWINFVYVLTSTGHKCFRRRPRNIIRRWKNAPFSYLAWCKSVFIQQTGPTASQYCQMRNSWAKCVMLKNKSHY